MFLEYQGSLECQVHQVGLEANTGREIITKVKMFVVVKNVLGTSDKNHCYRQLNTQSVKIDRPHAIANRCSLCHQLCQLCKTGDHL